MEDHCDKRYLFGRGTDPNSPGHRKVRSLVDERKEQFDKAAPKSTERTLIVGSIIDEIGEENFVRRQEDGTIITVPRSVVKTHLQHKFYHKKKRKTSHPQVDAGADSDEEFDSLVASLALISDDSSKSSNQSSLSTSESRRSNVTEAVLPPDLPLLNCHVESVFLQWQPNPSTGVPVMVADLQCKCDNRGCARSFPSSMKFNMVIACPFCNRQPGPMSHGGTGPGGGSGGGMGDGQGGGGGQGGSDQYGGGGQGGSDQHGGGGQGGGGFRTHNHQGGSNFSYNGYTWGLPQERAALTTHKDDELINQPEPSSSLKHSGVQSLEAPDMNPEQSQDLQEQYLSMRGAKRDDELADGLSSAQPRPSKLNLSPPRVIEIPNQCTAYRIGDSKTANDHSVPTELYNAGSGKIACTDHANQDGLTLLANAVMADAVDTEPSLDAPLSSTPADPPKDADKDTENASGVKADEKQQANSGEHHSFSKGVLPGSKKGPVLDDDTSSVDSRLSVPESSAHSSKKSDSEKCDIETTRLPETLVLRLPHSGKDEPLRPKTPFSCKLDNERDSLETSFSALHPPSNQDVDTPQLKEDGWSEKIAIMSGVNPNGEQQDPQGPHLVHRVQPLTTKQKASYLAALQTSPHESNHPPQSRIEIPAQFIIAAEHTQPAPATVHPPLASHHQASILNQDQPHQ